MLKSYEPNKVSELSLRRWADLLLLLSMCLVIMSQVRGHINSLISPKFPGVMHFYKSYASLLSLDVF